MIDLIWQAHIEGRDHGMSARNSAESPTLAEWWAIQQAIDKWYEQWSDKQTDETLADRRPVVLIGGNRVVMSLAEMLLHLYHHTAYHRGFAGDMMYQRAPAASRAGHRPAGVPARGAPELLIKIKWLKQAPTSETDAAQIW